MASSLCGGMSERSQTTPLVHSPHTKHAIFIMAPLRTVSVHSLCMTYDQSHMLAMCGNTRWQCVATHADNVWLHTLAMCGNTRWQCVASAVWCTYNNIRRDIYIYKTKDGEHI